MIFKYVYALVLYDCSNNTTFSIRSCLSMIFCRRIFPCCGECRKKTATWCREESTQIGKQTEHPEKSRWFGMESKPSPVETIAELQTIALALCDVLRVFFYPKQGTLQPRPYVLPQILCKGSLHVNKTRAHGQFHPLSPPLKHAYICYVVQYIVNDVEQRNQRPLPFKKKTLLLPLSFLCCWRWMCCSMCSYRAGWTPVSSPYTSY